MPEERSESRSGQGLGRLGLSIVGVVISFALGILGLVQRYADELDPCINEESIPCPAGSGRFFAAAAIVGIPAVIGRAVTLSKRFRK